MREYSPCYGQNSSLLFFLRRRAKKPKRGVLPSARARKRSRGGSSPPKPHGKSSMLSAACHFSLYSMGGSRYSVFAKLRYRFKPERSCLTEKSSLEIWAGHGAAWVT
jgi:hypothetical protein